MDHDLLLQRIHSEMHRRGVPYHFRQGELLIVQGSRPTSLILIADGIVQVDFEDEGTRGDVVARRSQGSIIGEMSLLAGMQRTANARAITPVNAWLLPAGDFFDL